MTLEELFLLIPRSFPQDDANYPGIEALSPDVRKGFMRRHMHLHMVKRGGQLANLLERQDHTGTRFEDMQPIDPRRALIDIVSKAMVDALMLAHVEGLTLEEIEREIRRRHDPSFTDASESDDS